LKATKQLRSEHEGIEVILNVLGRICKKLETTGDMDKDHFEGILEFLRIFIETCHHKKEEELLFPALVEMGVPGEGSIELMLNEHEMGKKYIKAMGMAFGTFVNGDTNASKEIVQNARLFISMLREHIEREEKVLFDMADDRLPEIMQAELIEGFEKIETHEIGPGKHEEFENLIRTLSRIYLI
jgi:hemerythrin-like domain-containing protein